MLHFSMVHATDSDTPLHVFCIFSPQDKCMIHNANCLVEFQLSSILQLASKTIIIKKHLTALWKYIF